MKKTSSLTRMLLAAGAIGLAGAANADAIFYPDGTMVELGDNGAELLALDSTPSVDTTVLGAPAATVTSTTVAVPQVVYVQPNIDWDRTTVVSQMRDHRLLSHTDRHAAAATFDVPARAGEASTMTGGVPNMVTDNQTFVVGSTSIPYSSLSVGQPYYVMSF
jgi:hypothetical protein